MPELAQAADGLHPAEDLFHEFSFPLTYVIARMPRGPTVDALPRTFCATWGVTSWTRTSATIVVLVRPDRAARGGAGLQRPRRVRPPSRAQTCDKPLSIVQQHVRDTPAWLPCLCPSDATSPRDRLMGVIAPPLPVEVDRGIARVLGRVALRCVQKAFQAGPCFQLRPIHGEVFVREQPGRPGVGLDRIKERGGDSARQQPVAILGKRRGMTGSSIFSPTNQEQQVVGPLAPHRVEHLQQPSAQPLLRWDRRTPCRGVQASATLSAGLRPSAPERRGADGRPARAVHTEHVGGLLIVSACPRMIGLPSGIVVRRDQSVDHAEFFSSLLGLPMQHPGAHASGASDP